MNYLTRYRDLRAYAKGLHIKLPWYYGNSKALDHLYRETLRRSNTTFTNRLLNFRSTR